MEDYLYHEPLNSIVQIDIIMKTFSNYKYLLLDHPFHDKAFDNSSSHQRMMKELNKNNITVL